MKYYRIADLNIAVEGADYTYFDNRMKEYSVAIEDVDTIDATVTFKLKDNIDCTGIKYFASKNGRYYFETKDKYGFYDYIDEIQKYVTLMEADKEFKNITYNYCDISKLFGAENEVAVTNVLGNLFRQIILRHNGVVVHASTIAYHDQGVTFTAPSGTGKSTHTNLWREYYNAVIINDDMPAIRIFDDQCYVYGTPWCGKTDTNKNLKVPLRAMVFLERSETNSIEEISPIECIIRMLKELQLSPIKAQSDLRIEMLDKIFNRTKTYLLKCDISKEAADTVKNKIFGGTL